MAKLLFWLGACLWLVGQTPTTKAQVISVKEPSSDLVEPGPWRFRAGDSIGWASPAYNDKSWAGVSPKASLDEDSALWRTGRGWFRQTFRLKRPARRSVTMAIQQFGTSTVFLDGRPVAVLRPAVAPGASQRIAALIPVPLDTASHVVAIRYSFRRDPVVGHLMRQNALRLDYYPSEQAATNMMNGQANSASIEYLLTGVFGILSLLHFRFYRANRAQRVHRVLALMMGAFALFFLLDQLVLRTGSLTLNSLMNIGFATAWYAAFGLLLFAVYTYLGRQLGWGFWGPVALLTGALGYTLFVEPLPGATATLPFGLILVEYTRVSWLAKRQNQGPDTRLPWDSLRFSWFSLAVLIPLAIFLDWWPEESQTGVIFDFLLLVLVFLTLLTLCSVPLGLSLSLVRDYAQTYQSLRKQFEEVSRLSAQTLAQEQEKQLLLASQKQVLEQQVAARTAELQQSMQELRATQTQLVQREKLASLGELSAGIAHEIQNPLNFVNNFSEVSAELVAELQEEAGKGARDKALEADLLADLGQNLHKINHHGRRVAAIVKGMLDHSRSMAGERHPTDLNALLEEAWALAYGAIRSKAPAFRVTLTTDLAADVGAVEVVPQEIGRVLLNLLHNALYAVRQRQQELGAGYQPAVTVRTRREAHQVVVRVRDNGPGIPAAARPKVFNPFFTTKPSGEGTGLGLSLSHDIIAKGHGGTLAFETEENAFTEFTITLPVA